MPRILPATSLSAETTVIFKEIEEAFGRVPDLFTTYAHHPPLLRANWNKVKAVMMEGTLGRKVKETIAVMVSRDNSCAYCIAAHTGALRALGVTEEELADIEEDITGQSSPVKRRR